MQQQMLTIKLGRDPSDVTVLNQHGDDITDDLAIKSLRVEARPGQLSTVVLECYASQIDLEKIQSHIEVISFTEANPEPEPESPTFEQVVGPDQVERFVVTNEDADNVEDVLYYVGVAKSGLLWSRNARDAQLMKHQQEAEDIYRDLDLDPRVPAVLRVVMDKDVVFCRCDPAPPTVTNACGTRCSGCGLEKETSNV